MLTIPAAIETLLKSKIMVGENRPTGKIVINGMPGNQSLFDPTAWTTWRTFVGNGKGNGNMCETKDGRAVIIYVESGSVKLAYSATVAGILNGTETFNTGAAVTIASGMYAASMALLAGKLHVIIMRINGSTIASEFWRDTDGNGTGLAKVSDISTDLGPNTFELVGPSLIHKLGNGNLVCLVPWENTSQSSVRAYYSNDDGATWIAGAVQNLSLGEHCFSSSLSFLLLDDDTFVTAFLLDAGVGWIDEWSSSGTVLTTHDWTYDWGDWPSDEPWLASFITVGNKHYICKWVDDPAMEIYELNSDTPTVANILSISDWTKVVTIPWIGQDQVPCFFTLTESALICQHGHPDYVSGAGTVVQSQTVQPKSITVDRSKGSASQVTVVLDNKGGKYSPDPTGPWHHIFWPNSVIEVYLGYGAEQQLVFTGLLDEPDMRNYPAEIAIVARDYGKLALDQMIQWTLNGVTYYGVGYVNQTPEYIFRDLALKAGYLNTKVHTDVSGLTFADIKFKQEMYGDAFQKLCELCGFEWFCDEVGDLYFRLAVEPAPVASYVFTEGVDIFGPFNYVISDGELYAKVVVVSQTKPENENEEPQTVWAEVPWSAAEYYNVLPQKTMYINATDLASTTEQCLELATRAANTINPKPRQVGFVVVGNPYLQIGDCIQVIETSSTISEIYRIFELTHQMDAQGSPVFATIIKCFHYAAA